MTAYSNLSKEQLIAEIKRLKKGKKFGLLWEDNPEDVAELCKTKLPVLVDVEDKEISSDVPAPTNILIEGDNYHALSVLNYTHKGRIDVIYIDPPYNTGARDWKYNNHYVDISDAYRHSKWLSMMEKRLLLAKSLLKADGVLIVAIDDNEVHRLRLLIEQIMPGHDITSVTIVQNPRGNITNNFARTHEYALYVIPRGRSVIERTLKDNATPRKLRRWGHNSTRKARPTMFYPIYVKKGKIVRVGNVPEDTFHPKDRNIVKVKGEIEVWPIDQNGIERRWNFSLDTINNELGRITAIESDGVIDLFVTQEDTTPKTVWTESELEAGRNGATLVKALTGVDFPFPKSIYTVIKCLRLVIEKRPNAVVLDFFGGSGTTGHAVLQLNKEDHGQRQFILCTNNENKIAEDVCYPRIKKVIKGHKEYSDITGIPASLKYFRTDFVDADPTDKNKKKLTEMATEMLCLKEGTFEKITSKKAFKIYKNTNHYTGIIFDQMAIPDFKEAINKMKSKFSVYVFSLGDDSFDEEFDDVKQKVKLSPIPEVILRVYRRIFK